MTPFAVTQTLGRPLLPERGRNGQRPPDSAQRCVGRPPRPTSDRRSAPVIQRCFPNPRRVSDRNGNLTHRRLAVQERAVSVGV